MNPYREPETTLPLLVTLAFATPAEAHEFMKSVKKYGGVLTPRGSGPTLLPARVMAYERMTNRVAQGHDPDFYGNMED